jgi:hypothetical protein
MGRSREQLAIAEFADALVVIPQDAGSKRSQGTLLIRRVVCKEQCVSRQRFFVSRRCSGTIGCLSLFCCLSQNGATFVANCGLLVYQTWL